jgi:hypothetical protein
LKGLGFYWWLQVVVAFDGANSMTGSWMGLEMPKAVGGLNIRGMAVFPDGHNFKAVWPLYLDVGIRMAIVPMTSFKVYYFIIWAGCKSEGECSTSCYLINHSLTRFDLMSDFDFEDVKMSLSD